MLSDTAKKNKDYSTLSRSSCSFADCLYSKNSSNAPHSIAGERLFFRLLLTIFPFSPYEKYNVLVTPVMWQLSIASLLSYWMAKPYIHESHNIWCSAQALHDLDIRLIGSFTPQQSCYAQHNTKSVNVFCCEIVTWITIYLSWRRSNTLYLYFVMRVLLENKINLTWYLGISTKNPRSPLQTANTATANFVDLMWSLHTKIVSSLLTCKHSKQRGGVGHYQNEVKHSSLHIRLV